MPKAKNRIKITVRDEELLKGLYSSTHTRYKIKEIYFKFCSEAVVSRRLHKLLRNNYLIEKVINGEVQFCLGEEGAIFLHQKLGYKFDYLSFTREKGFSIRRKKDTQYKKLILTERDMDVCEALASGPATIETLSKYFEKEDGTSCSRPFITRRLKKLEYFGLIKKVSYKCSNPSVIYYLDEVGAEELIIRRNHNCDSMRMNVVKREEVRHELMVTEVVRIICRDIAELEYKIRFLYDDHFLRKKYANQKQMAIPDLYLGIETDDGKKYSFCIEVDTGKRPAWTLAEKLKNYGGIIKIITLSHKRMELLKKTILDTVSDKVLLRAYIGVFSDIIKEGFIYSDVWTCLSNLLEKDSDRKSS